MKRDIIRVVTPGTVIDAACLDDKSSNFLCGICLESENAGVAFCDMTTGKAHLTAFTGADRVRARHQRAGPLFPGGGGFERGRRREKR